jgi:CBS domain-containing protein
MKARQIMTSNPEVLFPDDPISHAGEVMRTLDVGAMPVVEDRESMRLVGIVTDRDLVVRHLAEGHTEDCLVQHHMTERGGSSEFFTARPEDRVEYLMGMMSRHQVRRIPVVADGDERLAGIVALADVAREVGPRDPDEVVAVLGAIPEPSRDRTPAKV